MSKIVINQDFNYVSDGNDIITDLDALSDVNVTAAANGQILVYNGTSNKWENADNSEITGLTALSDVTITSVADDQFLRYDSTSGEWVNETISIGGASELDELTDVTITSVADNQFLRYDSGSSQFVNESVTIVDSLDDLSDVDTSGLADGEALVYNSTTSKWEPQAVGISGASIFDLTDVSGSGSAGDTLRFTAGSFQPGNEVSITAGTRVEFNIGQVKHTGNLVEHRYTSTANAGTGTVATVNTYAKNSSNSDHLYTQITHRVGDTTDGQEDGQIYFSVMDNGGLTTKLIVTNDLVEPRANTNVKDGWLQIEHTSEVPTHYLYRNETPIVDDTVVGSQQGWGRDDGGNIVKYTQIDHVVQDITDGTEDSAVVFTTRDNGTLTERMVVDPTGVTVTGTVTADTLDGTVIDGGTY